MMFVAHAPDPSARDVHSSACKIHAAGVVWEGGVSSSPPRIWRRLGVGRALPLGRRVVAVAVCSSLGRDAALLGWQVSSRHPGVGCCLEGGGQWREAGRKINDWGWHTPTHLHHHPHSGPRPHCYGQLHCAQPNCDIRKMGALHSRGRWSAWGVHRTWQSRCFRLWIRVRCTIHSCTIRIAHSYFAYQTV